MRPSREEHIIKSLDSAFEWLALLYSILLGLIFQFLTWVGKQPTPTDFGDLPIITKTMASLTLPLLISIIAWFYQKTNFVEERKMFWRLFSWNLSMIIYIYYIIFFAVCVYLGSINKISPVLGGIGLAIAVLIISNVLSFTTIYRSYRGATMNLNFWQRSMFYIESPAIISTIVGFALILLPFVFP